MSHRHQAMACTWELYLSTDDASHAARVAQVAFEELDRLEEELSRFVPHSDIGRINSHPVGEPLRIGVDAFECLELATRMHAETRGVFDVTLGTGFSHLEIDREKKTVTRHSDDVLVDLGGVGKGFAVDRLVELLGDWDIESALVHSGESTLYAIGAPVDADRWSLAIRDPEEHSASLGTVDITDQALSGSGTLLHGDHIVDPRPDPPQGRARGAWAIAPSAAVSDALSTSAMILSPAELASIASQHPVITLLVAGLEGLQVYGPDIIR